MTFCRRRRLMGGDAINSLISRHAMASTPYWPPRDIDRQRFKMKVVANSIALEDSYAGADFAVRAENEIMCRHFYCQ